MMNCRFDMYFVANMSVYLLLSLELVEPLSSWFFEET